MMSDDDRDIDIESDDGDDSDSKLRNSNNTQYYSQAEKRAHHNALERKRRDHIKDSFTNLRDAVPTLQGEKVASRAQILKKAADYIISMRRLNNCHQKEIDDLEKEVLIMESKVEELEKSKGLTRAETLALYGPPFTDSEDSDSSETTETNRQPKKLKMASLHH